MEITGVLPSIRREYAEIRSHNCRPPGVVPAQSSERGARAARPAPCANRTTPDSMHSFANGLRLSTLMALVWVSLLGLATSPWSEAVVATTARQDVASAAPGSRAWPAIESRASSSDESPLCGWDAAPQELGEYAVDASASTEEEEEHKLPAVGPPPRPWDWAGLDRGPHGGTAPSGRQTHFAGRDVARRHLVRGPPAVG